MTACSRRRCRSGCRKRVSRLTGPSPSRFAKWLPKLDELRANPEPAILEAMELLFPECPWPPASGTTFGPDRLTWTDAMAAATEAIRVYDLAPAGGVGDPQAVAGDMLGSALAFALRAQPLRRRRRG